LPLGVNRAPLYEALVAHAQLQATAFHVPGHKQRAAWDEAEAALHYASMLSLDVTELSDTDDLHHPQGPLAEAQELAAQCYGVEETRFLVGGSTSGNLSMIIGLCNPGDLVILQRNVHKSIIHGLMLAGARAVLLPPDIDAISGLATLPSEELLKATIKKHREARAVILSAPNYYGMSPDLKPLIQLAHEYAIPVLIDEAHGPHFGFHPDFPISALQADADIVVHSTHKMLSAMTMGAMLHMQGNRIPRQSVRQALTMVQSSSPSFPILASIDLARRQLHVEGERAFHSALEAVANVIKGLEATPFRALGYGEYANDEISYDPLKLVLFDETMRLSGFDLRDEFLRRNCVAEMADSRYVVMAFGTGSRKEDGESLSMALAEIGSQLREGEWTRHPGKPVITLKRPQALIVPEPVVIHRDTLPKKSVELAESIGMTAAEWVIPYPPGIPILYPGEIITAETIEELHYWSKQGAQIQGVQDTELNYIQVQMNP
jgi:arginine decarboxylase